jgi:hypothetical protein
MTLLSRAIDRLIASGFTSADVADALGVTNLELRNLRLARDFRFVDEAPAEWYQSLAELAWEKVGLESLAHELERA